MKDKKFNLPLFSLLMENERFRLQLSFRAAAKQIGISATTLMRIANQKFTPDLNIYYKLCKWMGVTMEYFFNQGNSKPTVIKSCPKCYFEPMIKVDEQHKCEMCGYATQ